jgi:outer membrane protein assembly factor BamA
MAVSFLQLAFGQDSLQKNKKVKVLPVPTFGYSPETKTYIGAVTLFTFNMYKDTLTRTSNAKLEFNYTWLKQIILESEWNYFFREEKWFTKGRLHYSKFPDLYYGIGSSTPDSNELRFQSNRIVCEANLLRKIGYRLFTGGFVRYVDYGNINYTSDKLNYPELKDNSSLGFGYSLLSDKRNNLLTPTAGSYFGLNTSYNFSQKNYVKITADARLYHTWKEKYTLAFRFVHDVNIGDPPFYDYAFLGGDKFVRGYYYGRFRDKVLSIVQTEFRFPVIWRFGMTAFGGFSSVYPEAYAPQLKKAKYNYGIGIRFMVDKNERTNLRFDYAIGENGNTGFYVAFGESF